jgi:hypothetical protein
MVAAAVAIAAIAMMVEATEAGAINAACLRSVSSLIWRNSRSLASFHHGSKASLESLQNTVFSFASRGTLQYRGAPASKDRPQACCIHDRLFL